MRYKPFAPWQHIKWVLSRRQCGFRAICETPQPQSQSQCQPRRVGAEKFKRLAQFSENNMQNCPPERLLNGTCAIVRKGNPAELLFELRALNVGKSSSLVSTRPPWSHPRTTLPAAQKCWITKDPVEGNCCRSRRSSHSRKRIGHSNRQLRKTQWTLKCQKQQTMAKDAEIRIQIETLRSRISNPFNAPLKPIRMKPLRPAKGPMDVSITFRSVQTPRAFHCGPFSSAVRRVFNPFVSGFSTHTTHKTRNSQTPTN